MAVLYYAKLNKGLYEKFCNKVFEKTYGINLTFCRLLENFLNIFWFVEEHVGRENSQ